MSEGLRYLRLPTVCMVMPMFSLYNTEKDTMETVSVSHLLVQHYYPGSSTPYKLTRMKSCVVTVEGQVRVSSCISAVQLRSRLLHHRQGTLEIPITRVGFYHDTSVVIPKADVFKFRLIVLEEVQPGAKWLLYLRPRRGQDRWLLFFNDAVTFAREREVFEDSFGGNHVAPGTPLRVPYVMVYAREDKLEEILG